MVSASHPIVSPSASFAANSSTSRSASTPTSPLAMDDPMADVPAEARSWFWRRLTQAIDDDLWDDPEGPITVSGPPTLSVPLLGHPPYDDALLRPLTLEGIRRIARLEGRLALECLEAWLSAPPGADYFALLREHCARLGQLYGELRRRLGVTIALLLLDWELRLLRYRHSGAVIPLIRDKG